MQELKEEIEKIKISQAEQIQLYKNLKKNNMELATKCLSLEQQNRRFNEIFQPEKGRIDVQARFKSEIFDLVLEDTQLAKKLLMLEQQLCQNSNEFKQLRSEIYANMLIMMNFNKSEQQLLSFQSSSSNKFIDYEFQFKNLNEKIDLKTIQINEIYQQIENLREIQNVLRKSVDEKLEEKDLLQVSDVFSKMYVTKESHEQSLINFSDQQTKRLSEKCNVTEFSNLKIQIEQLERNQEVILSREVQKNFDKQLKPEMIKEFVRKQNFQEMMEKLRSQLNEIILQDVQSKLEDSKKQYLTELKSIETVQMKKIEIIEHQYETGLSKMSISERAVMDSSKQLKERVEKVSRDQLAFLDQIKQLKTQVENIFHRVKQMKTQSFNDESITYASQTLTASQEQQNDNSQLMEIRQMLSNNADKNQILQDRLRFLETQHEFLIKRIQKLEQEPEISEGALYIIIQIIQEQWEQLRLSQFNQKFFLNNQVPLILYVIEQFNRIDTILDKSWNINTIYQPLLFQIDLIRKQLFISNQIVFQLLKICYLQRLKNSSQKCSSRIQNWRPCFNST